MHAARLVAAMAALLAVAPACAPPAPEPAESPSESTVQLDRTHDLVALFPRAALLAGDAYPLGRLPVVDDKLDRRDALAYLRAPPDTVIVWHQLPTTGPARLTFACGAQRLDHPPGQEAVRFTIEAMDVAAGETDFHTVFDRTLTHAELPQPAGRLPFEVDLGNRPAARWTLRFSTHRGDARPDAPTADTPDATPDAAAGDAGDAEAEPPAWPAWFMPLLRSDGRAVPVAGYPLLLNETVADLVADFTPDLVQEQAAGAPVRRALADPAPGVYVFGGERPALRVTAPSRIRYELDVPPGARFEFSYAMDSALQDGRGDGMDFEILIDGERAWAKRLEARRDVEDRGWKQQHLDMSPWAGRRVTVELITGVAGNALNDDGLWSHLRLVRGRPTVRQAAGQTPNVLLVVIDTLRADRLGSYGSTSGLTPRLDAHAAGAVLFRQSRSVSPWTWPSTATLLTGLTPFAHGVLGEGHTDLDLRLDTLPEVLARAGYTTGGFAANALVSRRNNFDQGFEEFVLVPRLRARGLNERVFAWLDGREQLALFTYVHYIDPHTPYNPPTGIEPRSTPPPGPGDFDARQRQQLQAAFGEHYDEARLGELAAVLTPDWRAYDAEVAGIDRAFGELLDEFERRGLLRDALIIVTSDHGEEFLEHGLRYHSEQVYEESLRVPLWIAGYGAAALEPRVIERPADLASVLPTLCALLGLEAPLAVTAPALLPGADAEAEAGRGPWFASTFNGLEPGVEGRTEKLAVRHDDWKLIHTPASGRTELYRLDRDPGEVQDLSADEPEITARLLERLLDWRNTEAAKRLAPGGSTSPESLYWLRELGYLGDSDG